MSDLPDLIFLSVRVAAVGVSIALVPGLLLGRLLARSHSRLNVLVRVLVGLPIVLPPVAVGLLLLWLLSPNHAPGTWLASLTGHSWILTWQAAALASAVMGFPLLVQGAEAGFSRVSLRDESLARSFGASRVRTLWSITLPLARRGILCGMALAFARGLAEFGATILVAGRIPKETETLSLALYDRYEQGDLRGAWTLALVSILLGSLSLILIELFLRERKP